MPRTDINIALGERSQSVSCPSQLLTVEITPTRFPARAVRTECVEKIYQAVAEREIQKRALWLNCVRDGCAYYIDSFTAREVQEGIDSQIGSGLTPQLDISIPFIERTLCFTGRTRDVNEYEATATILYQPHSSDKATIDQSIQIELEHMRDQFINRWSGEMRELCDRRTDDTESLLPDSKGSELTIMDIIETYYQRPVVDRKVFINDTRDLLLDGTMVFTNGPSYTILRSTCSMDTDLERKIVDRYRNNLKTFDLKASVLFFCLAGLVGYTTYCMPDGEVIRPICIGYSRRCQAARACSQNSNHIMTVQDCIKFKWLTPPIVLAVGVHIVLGFGYIGIARTIPYGLRTLIPLLAFGPMGLVYKALAGVLAHIQN